ncbi:MAG TPA: hypothetical protein VLA98_16180, partial [Solirubrobacteraceae bacterium]|nr:hypothetical protein [Solirubrobacteraceae bacterium]
MRTRRVQLSAAARARWAAVAGVIVAAVLIASSVVGLNSAVLPFRAWPAGDGSSPARPQRLPAPSPEPGAAGGVASPGIAQPATPLAVPPGGP